MVLHRVTVEVSAEATHNQRWYLQHISTHKRRPGPHHTVTVQCWCPVDYDNTRLHFFEEGLPSGRGSLFHGTRRLYSGHAASDETIDEDGTVDGPGLVFRDTDLIHVQIGVRCDNSPPHQVGG